MTCSIIVHVGSCLIERNSGSSVGVPTTDGAAEATYSCVASNCVGSNYDVHVIGNYESSNGRHGVFIPRVAGDTDVRLTGGSSRSLILVLTSYEPVRWRLNVISEVIIDRVIVVRKMGLRHSGP